MIVNLSTTWQMYYRLLVMRRTITCADLEVIILHRRDVPLLDLGFTILYSLVLGLLFLDP